MPSIYKPIHPSPSIHHAIQPDIHISNHLPILPSIHPFIQSFFHPIHPQTLLPTPSIMPYIQISILPSIIYLSFAPSLHPVCTCSNKQHTVRSLVEGVHSVHCDSGEVHALGEHQGLSFGLRLHQRVFLSEVQRGVRQLQRAVIAVLSVEVSDTLQRRRGTQKRRKARRQTGRRRFIFHLVL